MPNLRKPRKGSMQFWPRKRANRPYARIRSWIDRKTENGLLGFSGYKVGMTHIIVTDNRKNSKTKGQELSRPVTIIECPPIKVGGVRFYTTKGYGLAPAKDIVTKFDKEAARKISIPKKTTESELNTIKPEEYKDIRLLVYTQPKLTGRGNKKPELFEMGIAGSLANKIAFANEHLGKEITVNQVFKEGQVLDIHAVTTGRGFQGPVKRFGIGLRQHKSEKVKRGPGSLGGWRSQAHVMYRVAHAGQTGYHQRIEYNKKIMKMSNEPKDINIKGGFERYGVVKNQYLLLDGSVAGPVKRIIRMTPAVRLSKRISTEIMPIITIPINKE